MAKSILQKEKVCLVCKTTMNLHKHHVLYGPNRPKSEKYGLTVYLCQEHHTGNQGVHFQKQFNEELHQMAQMAFEEIYGHELFIQEFGRNYL